MWIVGTLMALPSLASGQFVMESGYHASIKGDGNTLRSMAKDVNDPAILNLTDEHTLHCTVSPYIYGQLILKPQDRLVISHPNWGRRFVFVYGDARWQDCTVEGAVWIDAGNSSTGYWKNVTIQAGDTKGYPLVWFRSQKLQWDGGYVNCFPKEGPPAAVCLGTRGGYIPGSFQNTIRNVTFHVAKNLLDDRFAAQRHNVDLTLERCIIETTGKNTANIVVHVNAVDGCTSLITLKDCIRRHNGVDAPASSMIQRGEVQVLGTAGKVRFVENGKVVAEVTLQDAKAVRMQPGNLLKTLKEAMDEIGPRLATLSADARLRGTLCYARARFDDLQVMRKGLEYIGRYGPADKKAVDEALAQIRDTLRYAPETIKTGSPFHPTPASLDMPPSGEATIEEREDGKLVVRTFQSEWVYTRNADGKHYATFLPESHVRGRPILGGAHREYGGPSVRYVYPGDSGTMLWEFPWQTRVSKPRGRIVAFETALMTSKDYGARATWVFFHDLPEVILCNARSFQPRKPGEPLKNSMVKMQAYARPELKQYNGMRMWNADPRAPVNRNAEVRTNVTSSDTLEPIYGFFYSESPWAITSVSKGLLVAQYNGRNDWRRNPPCGFIVRADQLQPSWVATGGYFTMGTQAMRKEPPRDEDDLNTQVLWFEGAGLKCWENIYNLEAAFSKPCQPLLDLTVPDKAVLKLWERAGLSRYCEMVVLPAPYAAMQSDREWYRGDVCVTLLRDVSAGSETPVGTLPVKCTLSHGEYRITNKAGMLRDLWVRVPVAGEVKTLTVNGTPAQNTISGNGWVAVQCDLRPGKNLIRWEP